MYTTSQTRGPTLFIVFFNFHAIVRDQSYEVTQIELSGKQKSDLHECISIHVGQAGV